MAFIPAPGVAELVMQYTGPNLNTMVNVYNVQRIGGGNWDAVGLQSLITQAVSWENLSARVQRSNQISLFGVRARDLSVQDGEVINFDVSPPLVGTQASPVLPAQVTFAISMRTGLAGRSRRGRTYWIGLAEVNVSGDFIPTVNVTAMETSLRALNNTYLSAAGGQLVVLSRYNNGLPRVSALATPVTQIFAVDSRVDTQRRRLTGEGN